MALILEQVGHTYGAGTGFAVPALSPIDLTVERGQFAVVLGPTGSGKSTLLGIAAGLVAPTTGRVMLDGRQLDGPAAGLRDGVGFVFQAPETQLFAETVLDDVAFGPLNQGMPSAEAMSAAEGALAGVGLDPAEFGSRSPFALSGGEARRVAIAGVLAMRPAYLLLDEPTAGLDLVGRSAVLGAIEVARSRTGIVVVTHDAEEFLGRADTVLMLADGRAMFQGSARSLIDDPAPFEATGLRAPEILRTLQSARASGLTVPSLTLDPHEAAASIERALAKGGSA